MISTRCHAAAAVSFALIAACSSSTDESPLLSYGTDPVLVRAGDPVSITPAVIGVTQRFEVTPALPTGLSIDVDTGLVEGSATAAASLTTYSVSASVDGITLTANLDLAVGPALPPEVASLEAGFWCERYTSVPEAAAKMALAPDGRVFFTELSTGSVRVVDTSGSLSATPFATVPVMSGSHLGLLGIAVSPSFQTDGFVYVYACTPAGSGKGNRGRVLRWRDVSGVGQDETVLLDDIPVSAINNGGVLCFDPDGMLLVSVGDTEDPALAQADGSFSGKILRLDPVTGGIPADNPNPASYIFATGVRNAYALAVHPVVESIYFADNGPTSDDELNLLQPGRNFEWGAGGLSFGAMTGARLRAWQDVVVPTGLAIQDPDALSAWPAPFDESLFLSLYDEQIVERFEMSGPLRTDIDREIEFLRFTSSGIANTPVDVQRGPEGQLWILTFTGIYRVDRIR